MQNHTTMNTTQAGPDREAVTFPVPETRTVEGVTEAVPRTVPETLPDSSISPPLSPAQDTLVHPPTQAELVRMYNEVISAALAQGGEYTRHIQTKLTVAGDEGIEKLRRFKFLGLDLPDILAQLAGDGFEVTKEGRAKTFFRTPHLTEADIRSIQKYTNAQGDTVLSLHVRAGADEGDSALSRLGTDFYGEAMLRDFMKSPGIPGLKITVSALNIYFNEAETALVLDAEGALRKLTHTWKFSAGVKDAAVRLAGVKLGGGAWANAFGQMRIEITAQ
jgi:hypothetical protein